MLNKVFVYGTLKEGGWLASERVLTENRLSVKPASIQGKMYNLGSFPGVTLEGSDLVHGEIHEFSNHERILPIMDRMEGYHADMPMSSMYRRLLIDVDGERCWIYVYNLSVRESDRIMDGVWNA